MKHTPVSADDVKNAAEYLASGGLGEVMGMLLMAQDLGQEQAIGDTAMLIALCAMAGEHIKNRPGARIPVRVTFGAKYGRKRAS